MILLWLATGAALATALVALGQARRATRKLEQLSQSYWELRYQQGEFRVQLQRSAGEPLAPAPTPAPAQGRDSFVPLSSLKR